MENKEVYGKSTVAFVEVPIRVMQKRQCLRAHFANLSPLVNHELVEFL